MPEEGKMKRQLKELIVGGAGGTVLGLHKRPIYLVCPLSFTAMGDGLAKPMKGGFGGEEERNIYFWKTSW